MLCSSVVQTRSCAHSVVPSVKALALSCCGNGVRLVFRVHAVTARHVAVNRTTSLRMLLEGVR